MLRDSEDLGIAYLASSLEQAGQPCVILDQGLTRLDDEGFSAWVLKQGPQVIGYSDNSDQLDRVVKIAARIRDRLPGVFQVIGDHGASFHADRLLTGDTGFDAVCIGEGEATLVELLQRLQEGRPPEGVPGLLTRIGGRAGFSPRPKIANPSELPWPKRYVLSPRRPPACDTVSCTIIGSRGCPYRCSFCGNDLYQKLGPGVAWRPRATSELVDEMEYLHRQHGVERFTFLDELFVGAPGTKNRRRLFSFCDQIRRRGLKITFRVTARADFFEPPEDRELVLALREAGLEKIFFGIENGYPATITLYHKGTGITPERMIRNINFVRDNGVFLFISFIMFHPFVTEEELLFNLDFIHHIANSHLWSTYASRLRVSPDIAVFKVVKNSGLLHGGKNWGERPYSFADRRMNRVWDRFNRAGQYFHEVDRGLEQLLYKLFYAGAEGRRLHESIRCQVGATYRHLGKRLLREEAPKSELLALNHEIKSLMNLATAHLDRL